MESLTLQYLIEQVAILNDTAAFEKLYYHYYNNLKRFAIAIVSREEIAEEVVSDVFVNVWRNRSRLLEVKNLDSYLYVAVRNIGIRKISQEKTATFISLDQIEVPAVDTRLSPEDVLMNKEVVRQIEKVIEMLPPRCRTIFRLAKQDGLRYKEIAAILNLSVKTIDAQMAIAVRRISQALKYNSKPVRG